MVSVGVEEGLEHQLARFWEQKSKNSPSGENCFEGVMKVCLQAVVTVLERQYAKYFVSDLSAKLQAETESARLHNIDAEEIIGMFGSLQKRAPNATTGICYLSSKFRAHKNRSVDYLDKMDVERREALLKKAVHIGQKQRTKRMVKQRELCDELIRREEVKHQAIDMTERNGLEKRLKKTTSVDKLAGVFRCNWTETSLT